MLAILKRIELYGFKSFADKIDIDFESGITAIVGPNGCGKSNVADAIRWVLGEQSSKTLRGHSMQDVIFKGTEKRKSLSYCEVSLVFDNTEHVFNLDYNEVILSRKLYKSGDSEYLINREVCRLKEIVALLHDVGIGKEGYSIIGQGKVDEIISSKPEDRRAIFEEAAGIAKHRLRKDESERKLQRTLENQVRITDIISEMQRQLNPLEKQAESAKKYLDYKEKLKNLETNAYIYQHEKASEIKENLSQKVKESEEEIHQKSKQSAHINRKYADKMTEINSIDESLGRMHDDILQITVAIEKFSGETKLYQQRMDFLDEQLEKFKQEEEELNKMLAVFYEEKDIKHFMITEKEALAKQLYIKNEEISASYLKSAEALQQGKTDVAKEKQRLEKEVEDLEAALQKAQQNLFTAVADKMAYESRIKLLTDLANEGGGYAHSVKKLLAKAQTDATLKKRILGTVAQSFQVDEKYAIAIEMALGSSISNVITENEDDAQKLIAVLKQNNFGRATMLPLTSVKVRKIEDTFLPLIKSESLGIASQLISFDKKFEKIFESLLGGTVICKTLEDAVRLAKSSRYSFKIVSLEGDIIQTQGSLTGGSRKAEGTSLLLRERELEATKNQLAETLVSIQSKEDAKSKLAQNLTDAKKQLDTMTRLYNETEIKQLKSFNENITAVKVQTSALNSEITALKTDADRLQKEINVTMQKLELAAEARKKAEKAIAACEVFKDTNADGKLLHAKTQKLNELKEKLNGLDQYKKQLQAEITEIETQRQTLVAELDKLQDRKFNNELALGKVDSDLEFMAQRIFEEYQLDYPSSLAYKQEEFDYEKAMPEIATLKRQIAALGNVNVNAIEDIRELKERYTEYKTQEEDLLKAEADIRKAIKELAAEMSKKFAADFAIIQQNFTKIFKELFGGGNAKLLLTESSDILASGIDIVAEPPGKKLQSITLLSGGEKALTAIAILFAILRLRPMPFCLLDEIEAALDEANVGRFAAYLKRFSKETQFIVITHRKPTMEQADSLYGVTMEEKGVSKMVSVKLSDVSDEKAG